MAPTVTDHVLDLIDHTIEECGTSGDAARWVPPGRAPAPLPMPDPPVTIRLTCLITPAGMKLGLDAAHLKAQLRRQHGKRKAGRALRRLAAVLDPPPPPAHPRIRRMHTEYCRRNRGR